MSSDNTTVTRTSFASRLLSKAMNDRKMAPKTETMTTADAAQYAVHQEKKEAAETVKS